MTLFLVFIIGLSIGSFLNVVIYRLPLMLNGDNISIASPSRSFCVNCKHKLTIIDLIPVFSFFLLRRCCRYCKHPISIQYPIIELTSALISVLIVYKFGIEQQTIYYLLFMYAVIPLFMIDLKHQLLPDLITLPLLWVGLIFNITYGINLKDAVIGAVFGYLILWSIYWIFKFVRGIEGMGYGDFKLTAALGAWLGWQYIPDLLAIASISSIVTIVLLAIIKKKADHIKKPHSFGPFLIISGVILLFSQKNFINNILI